MAEKLASIKKVGGGESKTGPQLIGTYSGNQSINVSQYLNPGDTVSNFIIEIASVTTYTECGAPSGMQRSGSSSASMSKSLSGNTLSISAPSAAWSFSYSGGSQYIRSTASYSYRVYHV